MKTISKNQYYQVVGLMFVIHEQVKHLEEMEASLAELLEVGSDIMGDYGHISDASFDKDVTALRLLKKLQISVNK